MPVPMTKRFTKPTPASEPSTMSQRAAVWPSLRAAWASPSRRGFLEPRLPRSPAGRVTGRIRSAITPSLSKASLNGNC